MASWSALSMLPDVDVIGFSMGVKYGEPWGHRGATHSLSFAIALGLVIGLTARRFERPAARTALFAGTVLASHGLLDTMTDGGLGAALLWPFDLTRYFAPWRPIPVAPIGLDFFSPYGLTVSLTELLLFAPLFVLALRSRPLRVTPIAAGVVAWLIAVWLLSSADPVRESIVGRVLHEDTAYSSGFSEQAFRTIAAGQSEARVTQLLGVPFGQGWFYFAPESALELGMTEERPGCRVVRFERGAVLEALGAEPCREIGIRNGMTPAAVMERLGPPPEQCWEYSWSPSGGHHRARAVCMSYGKVIVVMRRWSGASWLF
jgi:inner membrane protein